MEYFIQNPTVRLRVRQIEREVKVPLPSVTKYVKELEAENILKSQVISNVQFFMADRSSKDFILEKKLHNQKKIEKLKEYLIEELDNPLIILFGSYLKGEDTEEKR